MYNNIVKIAKNIIAKNEAKKLLEYLIDDKYKDNNPSQNEIQILKAKINEIQKQSFNFPWFVHRFIQEHKHFQDVQDLLKVQQAYKKLNKQLRTFQFEDNKSFSDFHNFMEKYLNKNVKNQEFKAPSYCKLIHSDSKYNYYYADAKDQKCYEDLHKCNMIDKNGQDNQDNQYAKWCVVVGTMSWGRYTDTEFPFYVYVTYKNNIPVMLFNFGYDSDCQIKDIHNDPFTKYDEQLLTGIKQLAKKYNFDITENEYDFKTFNEIDELYNKQFDELNIDKNIISESNKYNGLNFIQQNIIYDFKKNQKAYLIANDNIVNLQGYKINLYLLNLLKAKDYIDLIVLWAKNDKFLSSCSQQIFTFMIQVMIDNKDDVYLCELIKRNEIKDENKVKEIIQVFIDKEQYRCLYSLIFNDKIKDENKVKEIIQVFIDKGQYHYLYDFIIWDNIKDENQLKQSIQVFIDKKKYADLTGLIRRDKIKDENKVKEIIRALIDDGDYEDLSYLIIDDKIKDENIVKQIIQASIDKKEVDFLYNLIERDKIKDENLVKQIIQVLIDDGHCLGLLIKYDKIKDENQLKQSIQVLIDKEQNIISLYNLIKRDKIKDENLVKQIIQVFIDKEKYSYLSYLIQNNKIKDENLMKQCIQALIDKEKYDQLYELIEKNKINQSLLTQEQKELLKKKYPNLKLSKKLVNIATILKG